MSFTAFAPLDPRSAVAAFEDLILIEESLLRRIDHHPARRLQELVVFVGVAHRHGGLARRIDFIGRGRFVERDGDDHDHVIGVGEPIAALVRVGSVVVLREVSTPSLRGEAILGERTVEDAVA